jgi:hypothetical protein
VDVWRSGWTQNQTKTGEWENNFLRNISKNDAHETLKIMRSAILPLLLE